MPMELRKIRKMAAGQIHCKKKIRIPRNLKLSVPLSVNSSMITFLFIYHPAKIETIKPPIGRQMLDDT